MKIYWIKFVAFLENMLSKLVYNFHKTITGVKSVNNIAYNKKPTRFNKLNIHYKEHNYLSGKKVPIIIYFHGGGWTNYNKDIFTTLNRRIADMGYVVFSCNYGLSPKYKLDDIMNDCIQAVQYIVQIAHKYGGDLNQIYLAGDSAGAHISAMLCAYAKNDKKQMGTFADKIKGLILFYGVFNLKTALDSKFHNIRDYINACTVNKIETEQWESELEEFSPALYDLTTFPPCFLASGEVDKLHDSQSLAFSKQLEENHVKTHTVFFDDKEYKAMHAFMVVDGISTNVKVLSELENFLAETTK